MIVLRPEQRCGRSLTSDPGRRFRCDVRQALTAFVLTPLQSNVSNNVLTSKGGQIYLSYAGACSVFCQKAQRRGCRGPFQGFSAFSFLRPRRSTSSPGVYRLKEESASVTTSGKSKVVQQYQGLRFHRPGRWTRCVRSLFGHRHGRI